MADIEVTTEASGEFMVIAVTGLTDVGDAFVDGFVIDDLHVVDSGRIVIPTRYLADLMVAAKEIGVEVDFQ